MATDYVTRAEWGSAYPRGGNPLIGPLAEVYVHHFGGEGFDYSAVGAVALGLVRGAQRHHVETNGWSDIGYSWLVDDAGVIIEGRGWLRTGAHTENFNSKGHGICWIGNSELRWPSAMALEGIARCIRYGQAAGAVVASPTIVGHSDRVPDTACCGDHLAEQLPIIRRLLANRTEASLPVSSYPTTTEEPPVIHAMQLPRTNTPGDATVYVRNEATGRVFPLEQLGGLEVYNELVSLGLARPFTPERRLSWGANLALAVIDEANVNDGVPDVPRPGRFPVAS